MKRLIEIAFLFVVGTGIAQASGGIGGSGTVCIFFDSTTHTIYVPAPLDERFEITRGSASSGYYMGASDFARLQDTADSYQAISAKGETEGTRSYYVVSGDKAQQVELVDRREKARSDVAK